MTKTRRNPNESGAAMVLVLTVLAALLAGGAVALMLQRGSTKSSGLTASNRRALYCAESGLAAARTFALVNRELWNSMLDADDTNDPAGWPIQGDFDADGNVDYEVTARDDDDDADPNSDNNGRIFLVSQCIKWPAFQAEIVELIDISNAPTHQYKLQDGRGAAKMGNENVQ